MVFAPGPSDPFYALMQPPADETPAQKTARQKQERDAQRHSDQIDEDIKKEKAEATKRSGVIKVLLLGQSESGKSTTLKNFRMQYSQAEWEAERNGWRGIVQLNAVRCITSILRVVEAEMSGDSLIDSGDDRSSLGHDSSEEEGLKFTDRHQLLVIRLEPLRAVEGELKGRLGAGSEDAQAAVSPMSATPFDEPELSSRRRLQEFSVRSWKDILIPQERHSQSSSSSASSNLDVLTLKIAECKDDMKALWDDRTVRLALKRSKLQLPDSAGFFLNNLDRIATRDYRVTDDDIVRARLRTVGIQEYRLLFERGLGGQAKSGNTPGCEWRIFDVGGCRTLRAAWLPFFENVNVIIFLSPVSVFDEQLKEDPKVNRLEDSILLWTSICSSKLLAKTQLILFLNKCDLLGRKLKRGVRVKQHLASYGDRPNEVIYVIKYFQKKFKEIQRQCSPEPRTSYVYPTTVTDTDATRTTLKSVYDGVLRETLSRTQLV